MGVETELTTNGEEEGGEDGGEVREGETKETKETKVATSTVVPQTVTAWEDYLLDEEEEGKYFKAKRASAIANIFFTTHSILLFLIISNFFFVLTFKYINFRRGRGGTSQPSQSSACKKQLVSCAILFVESKQKTASVYIKSNSW